MTTLTRVLLVTAATFFAKPAFAGEPRVIAGFLGVNSCRGEIPALPSGYGLPALAPNPNDPGNISDITALFSAVDSNPNIPPEIKAQLRQQLIRLSLERRALADSARPVAAPPSVEPERGVAGFMGVPLPTMPIPQAQQPPVGFQGATTAR